MIILPIFGENKVNQNHDAYEPVLGDICAVDLYGGYIPENVTQESKTSMDNVNKSHQCNLERFGLTVDGNQT